MDRVGKRGSRCAYKYLGLHYSLVEAKNLVVFVLLKSHVGWVRAQLNIVRVDTSILAEGVIVSVVEKLEDKRTIRIFCIRWCVNNTFKPENTPVLRPLVVDPFLSVKNFDNICLRD